MQLTSSVTYFKSQVTSTKTCNTLPLAFCQNPDAGLPQMPYEKVSLQ